MANTLAHVPTPSAAPKTETPKFDPFLRSCDRGLRESACACRF